MNMGWKTTLLEDYDEKGIADNQTLEVVKLPPSIISSIHVRLSGTGGSGTPAVDNLISQIKIKTAKGYIFDMRSADMQALAKAKTGRKPQIINATSAYSQTCHNIYFGRYPRDKSLMLNLQNDNVRIMEISFGSLIGNNAFATGTVRLTVTIDEWIGALPSGYRGFFSQKEVEDKATGTGKATFELFSGNKLAGLLINIGTIDTVRQITVSDKSLTTIFAKANLRDLLNKVNSENINVDALETNYVYWIFYDKEKDLVELPILSMSDPVCMIERGTTTTTSRVVQIDLVS